MLLSKFGFGLIIWVLLIIIISLNLYIASRLNPSRGAGLGIKAADDYVAQLGLSGRSLNSLLIALILILSFYIASKGSYQWAFAPALSVSATFWQHGSYFLPGTLVFYVFSLPFYMFARDGLFVLFVMSGLVTAGWYLKNGALQIEGEFSQTQGAPPSLPKITVAPKAKQHLIFLGGNPCYTSGLGFSSENI